MRFHLPKVILFIAAVSLATFSLAAAGEVVILDYHSFNGKGSSSIDYAKDELAAQIDRIIAMGYKIVSLDDAIAGRIDGKANLVITIDDGNHSVYPAFKEVLEPRGIKPDLFIYPAIIGKNRYALTADQLRELADAGCGVGAHGFYHEYMTAKAYAKNPAKVLMEATRPAAALKKLLGKRPLLFAYPFGVGCPQAEEALSNAGYQWAFIANDKLVPVRFDDPDLPRYAVPRTIVYHWNREAVFKLLEARLRDQAPSK